MLLNSKKMKERLISSKDVEEIIIIRLPSLQNPVYWTLRRVNSLKETTLQPYSEYFFIRAEKSRNSEIDKQFVYANMQVNPLTTSVPHHVETQCNVDLQCQWIDWFLYDGEHWSLMG